jgi:hypothetical protein
LLKQIRISLMDLFYVCPAANPSNAMVRYFGDALYGFEAFFDPSIKVGGYSTGSSYTPS